MLIQFYALIFYWQAQPQLQLQLWDSLILSYPSHPPTHRESSKKDNKTSNASIEEFKYLPGSVSTQIQLQLSLNSNQSQLNSTSTSTQTTELGTTQHNLSEIYLSGIRPVKSRRLQFIKGQDVPACHWGSWIREMETWADHKLVQFEAGEIS